MIREATAADHDRLREIQAAALDAPWPGLLDVAVDGPPTVLVITDGVVVGYALVVPDDPVAYLAELAVDPRLQDQGYGTYLLDALLQRLRDAGFETLRLTARADDERVRSFYDDFGFQKRADLPDHYDDGDGVLLVLDL